MVGETTVGENMSENEERVRRSGTVALIGRPNAGKSTFLNKILREKLAIVSDKPQTTRHRIIGIVSDEEGQVVFYDTPGVHRAQHRMNRQMVQHARDALKDADVICLLVDMSVSHGSGDDYMLELIAEVDSPRLVALNKIDRVAKPLLLPRIERYASSGHFKEIVPISALKGDGTDDLFALLRKHLPEGEPLYDEELLTLHPDRFLVTERIREKILHLTRDELPFATTVRLDDWEEEESGLVRLRATVLVERPGQKQIVIGKGGSMIKQIGIAAREDLERFLGRRVYLDLHVRLQAGWREDRQILAELDRDLYGQLLDESE